MEKTTEKYRGSLSSILSGLVESVANLSHTFFRYEAKYTITSIVPNDNSLALDTSIPINRLGKTVQWPTSDDSGLTECGEDDLTALEILKTHLAPSSIIYGCVRGKSTLHISLKYCKGDILIWDYISSRSSVRTGYLLSNASVTLPLSVDYL